MVLMGIMILTPSATAKGPSNAGGNSPTEIGIGQYNWISGNYIGPSVFGIGTPTTIYEDGVTIYVSAIPDATYNEETGEWEGTHLMWKARYGNTPEKSWSTYKFWLNGAGPVTITYDYGDSNIVYDHATEFIFFKWDWGTGEITLQAYK